MNTLPAARAQLSSIEALATEPWKNGGGITRTLAQDAGAAPPAWRISVADITADGDFSRFENIERISVLLRGPGLQLQCAGTPHTLERLGAVLRYGGADATRATLGSGPARLLNVMLHGGRARAQVQASPARLAPDARTRVLLLGVQGEAQALLPGQPALAVAAGHYVWLQGAGMAATVQAATPDARWCAVLLEHLPTPRP